jgi:hypothetical protein
MRRLGRARGAVRLALLLFLGATAVVPYLHTCGPTATGPFAVRAADDHGSLGSTHLGCAACALWSTARMWASVDGASVAPSRESASVAVHVVRRHLSENVAASAGPRAPPSF